MQLFKKDRIFLAIIFGCVFLFNITSYAIDGTSFSGDKGVASSEAEDLWVDMLKVLIPGAGLAIGWVAINNNKTETTTAAPTTTVATTVAYVANYNGGDSNITACDINTDTKQFVSCAAVTVPGVTFGGSILPTDVVLNSDGSKVYISLEDSTIRVCDVANKTFSNCAIVNSNINTPRGLAINGSYLYMSNANNNITVCEIEVDGSLKTSCSIKDVGFIPQSRISFKQVATTLMAYVIDSTGSKIHAYPIGSDGSLGDDSIPAGVSVSSLNKLHGIAWESTGTYLYVAGKDESNNSFVYRCVYSSINGLDDCTVLIVSGDTLNFGDITINNLFVANTDNYLYVPQSGGSTIAQCSISDTNLTCTNSTEVGAPVSVWVNYRSTTQ